MPEWEIRLKVAEHKLEKALAENKELIQLRDSYKKTAEKVRVETKEEIESRYKTILQEHESLQQELNAMRQKQANDAKLQLVKHIAQKEGMSADAMENIHRLGLDLNGIDPASEITALAAVKDLKATMPSLFSVKANPPPAPGKLVSGGSKAEAMAEALKNRDISTYLKLLED